MSQIDSLQNDLDNLTKGEEAKELLARGWVKLPEKYEDIAEFLKSGQLDDTAAERVQNLVNFASNATRIALKPIQQGTPVEVLREGTWLPGVVSTKQQTGLLEVDTERGPVAAYEGQSRVRLRSV